MKSAEADICLLFGLMSLRIHLQGSSQNLLWAVSRLLSASLISGIIHQDELLLHLRRVNQHAPWCGGRKVVSRQHWGMSGGTKQCDAPPLWQLPDLSSPPQAPSYGPHSSIFTTTKLEDLGGFIGPIPEVSSVSIMLSPPSMRPRQIDLPILNNIIQAR